MHEKSAHGIGHAMYYTTLIISDWFFCFNVIKFSSNNLFWSINCCNYGNSKLISRFITFTKTYY